MCSFYGTKYQLKKKLWLNSTSRDRVGPQLLVEFLHREKSIKKIFQKFFLNENLVWKAETFVKASSCSVDSILCKSRSPGEEEGVAHEMLNFDIETKREDLKKNPKRWLAVCMWRSLKFFSKKIYFINAYKCFEWIW